MGWLAKAWTPIAAGLLGVMFLAPRTAPPLAATDGAAIGERAPGPAVPAAMVARMSPASAARALASGGPLQIAASARHPLRPAARFADLVERSQLHPPRPRLSLAVSQRGPPRARG